MARESSFSEIDSTKLACTSENCPKIYKFKNTYFPQTTIAPVIKLFTEPVAHHDLTEDAEI